MIVPNSATPARIRENHFGAYYYRHCCGRPYQRTEQWLAFFGAIADAVCLRIRPRTVLDAGCALGLLVECLRTRGVDAEGVDISSWAIANAHESIRRFCSRFSLTEPLTAYYELIICIEVLEHLTPADGDLAVANLCSHTDDILFSSSPYDQREPTHVNVQPPEYWAEVFARHGFYRDTTFDATFITPWAVRFRRRAEPPSRIVADYERQFAQLARAASEARAHALEVQGHAAALEERLEGFSRELANSTVEREALRAGLASIACELRQAYDRIRHMERSRFWRARQRYVSARTQISAWLRTTARPGTRR